MSNKIKTGFKVVSRIHSIFRSAFIGNLRYEINKWTNRPEGNYGPLAAFDRLCDVEQFLANNIGLAREWVVFLCEYIESEERYLYSPHGSMKGNMLPHGTVLADKVKLIKEVHNL